VVTRSGRAGPWDDEDAPGYEDAGPRVRKVRSVRLVSADDPEYVAAMAAQATAHRRYGEKQDPGATYRASGVVESAVLSWLNDRERLRPERVIAADVLPADGRSYERLWLELDAVADLPDGGLRVHEVKFTSSPNALLRGFRQLRRASRLLRTSWPRVETLVVAVPADGGTYARDHARLSDVTWLTPDALAGRIGSRTVLVLGMPELADRLDDAGRALLAAAQTESQALVRERRVRQERRDAGEEVDAVEQPRRPAATLAFADEADSDDASPFAVLSRLREREES
jgi:hypothetical protein